MVGEIVHVLNSNFLWGVFTFGFVNLAEAAFSDFANYMVFVRDLFPAISEAQRVLNLNLVVFSGLGFNNSILIVGKFCFFHCSSYLYRTIHLFLFFKERGRGIIIAQNDFFIIGMNGHNHHTLL